MANERNQSTKCPPRNELLDYLLGRLPDELLCGLENHFAVCDQCEETLRGIGGDDTFSRLAENAMSEKATDDDEREFVSKLVTQLRNDDRFRVQPRVVQERSAEVIRFLSQSDAPECLGRLANYRIERVLGAGSSGVVFYAVDESLDRPLALKVLRPSLGSAARQRFMVEARTTASINHPQIVTIYQVGEESELAFIAMQWLPGETMEARLDRVTFLPESEVRAIASQIVSGLQAAHEKMLVHRDIKPANIWLCEKTGEVKILDFGLARIADDDPHLTSTGMLAGTPNFMSPEQTRGQELDGRTDLFSLGCLMYRAATGKLPFGETGILATLQSIQHHHPRPPIELNPNIEGDFSDLVMCLLEKQPVNRPSSALNVAEALNQPRERWPFSAARHPVESSTRGSLSDVQKAKPENIRHLKWIRWVAAATLIGLATWGWSVFGQQIIRIATNHGEIVIESNDDNISVEILKDGELIRVVDLKTEQKVEIKAGEYEIKAGTNGGENSISVQPNMLTMTRGGKQVVTISHLDPNIDSPGDISENRTEPTYDGRTFDDWFNQMRHEKSQKFIGEGAVALSYLARDDKIKTRRAMDCIRPLIREHGSNTVGAGSTWPETFNAFFTQLNPRDTVGFAIEEMDSGTEQSREQMVWNFLLGSIYEGDSRRIVEHQKVIREQFQSILDKGLELIESDLSGGDSRLIRDLLSFAIRSATQEIRSSSPLSEDRGPGFVSNVRTILEERLAASHNTEVRAFLASQLVGMEPQSQLGVREFCALIGDPNVTPDLTSQMYFNYLALLSRDDIPQVVPSLIKLYNDDSMCDRLAKYYFSVIDPVVGGGGLPNPKSRPENQRYAIRHQILVQLGNYGEKAKAALPWLDELASQQLESDGDQAMPNQAKQSGRQIRGLGSARGGLGGGAGIDDTLWEPEGGSANQSELNKTEPDNSSSTQPPKESAEKTLYGKALAEWMRIVATELDRKTLLQACKSIGELAVHDRKMAASATQSLLEWIDSTQDFPADDPRKPARSDQPAMDLIIAAAIHSLSKIPIESAELDQRTIESVTRVVRETPVIKMGSRTGSSYSDGKLLQDAIGDAACEFFARHLKPEQAIEFVEHQLVSGSDNSSFRLRHLPGEPEFVTTIQQVMSALTESIDNWPAAVTSKAQRSCTHEFLRLGVYYFKSDEFKSAAETAMKSMMSDQK